ncbi:hypothetical protein CcaverHIS002_0609040 [Cutaneotrichosporon cavernicola]|uniref:Uncharacterized protein n=1 Tax=Cutaneotrichosporon cavernicola TaxID=279322 RepID=A0AA48L9M1_9TREE|nr:uncharacterized protein CcaverHIS019_0608500 [Cutaneotrichosporon cavernicola]BEI86617.1 hypothetical protein CcaverHIS002_0609040 [Cutaneotrichosporon cavernicola]BEI94391.1 hypothetical protein CcaverHIS019_0608500 [Cutaneotrichosporon cavernicola]BEJ02168.1 hypothetical protein CcaverHIS631_0608500 [Cutaneotrichosporon cavernicola]BEJ09929.1 hypothetical protein CcaverHIS641_0608440 [Cutaneotrichosporon cavernicola]
MSFAGLNTGNNLSLYAVPAAFGLAIAPHLYALGLVTLKHPAGAKGFDFSFPGNTRKLISESRLSPTDQERYLRAEAANDNGFVGLGFFAAAVAVGNAAGLSNSSLNRAAGVYLASRLAYNLLYILGTNNAAGIARTVAWMVGSFSCVGLFCEAGDKLSK